MAGCTALHFAAANGHEHVVRYLLGRRAELKKNNRGNTPLHWAVQNSQEKVVELLLAHEQSDVLDRNDCNISALTYACEANDENITALLLSHQSAGPLEEGAQMEVCESVSEDLLSPEDAAIVEETTLELRLSDPSASSLKCRLLGLSWRGEAFSGTDAARDSTGVYLWAASVITARWICEMKEELRGKSFCEIGAGCGLPSLAAMAFTDAQVVLATDSFKHSLENLRINMQLNEGPATSGRMQIEKLDWTDESSWPSAESFDILVGSDILYDHEQVDSICRVANHLLRRAGGKFLYAAPPHRDGSTLLISSMETLGFKHEVREAPERFYENPLPSEQQLEMYLSDLAGRDCLLHTFSR
ncbi:hypothetical protein GUITHDRAFT_144979 [Guillardia theta CCMP2712]|uniref:Uncharacterized protein n=1 Tax=Guillardia theta (strain CCMP2712) TaxID=905079 RepID=L1INE1_GUITC|nr:hypothetical protein GUITHDRAFT_144979 [Guillardia theta CCMP2712]EKX37419.1 hypothetical protein GUITHDRAFT_144979 [Guillardia theta CCMP2712]|eukprot:XP_005824399.1 hypothetical protein GUITHDRAFT_144979 [Guillardia theta CCMP2712]